MQPTEESEKGIYYFCRKPRKRLVGKSRQRCEVVKLNHKEREYEGVYGFEQTQDKVEVRGEFLDPLGEY
jgi:hypothetical protein